MSQYQGYSAGSPSPTPSGAPERGAQRRDPVSPQGSGQSQGICAKEEEEEEEEEHAGRGRNDALDISQALDEIRQAIRQLQGTLRSSSRPEASSKPYQQASFAVLTDIADDISDCLNWLTRIGSRNNADARPGQPAPQPGGPGTASVLQREDAVVGQPRAAACLAPVVPPLVASMGVAPSALQGSGPYGPRTVEAVQLRPGSHPNANGPYLYPYVQSRVPFPPAPGLYHSQWVQSPTVSPLMSATFFQQQQQQQQHQHHQPLVIPGPSCIQSLATVPDPAVVFQQPPPQQPNTTPSNPHQGSILLHREGQGQQGQQQQQPLFPSPGGGVTMSLPLHYDTPAGTRTALYQSYLPDHHPSGQPQQPPQPVQELAAETPPPSPPARAPMGPDGHRSSARRPVGLARVDSGSGSGSGEEEEEEEEEEGGLDGPGVELRWGYVLGE